MQWDLGLQGIAVLVLMSLGFGLVAQLVAARRTNRWVGLIAAAVYFVSGLFISEVWFGWATEEDLQPNIDGLSFDEVLLIGLVPGIAAVLATGYLTRKAAARRGTTGTGSRAARSSRHRLAGHG
jgi:MFS family permease